MPLHAGFKVIAPQMLVQLVSVRNLQRQLGNDAQRSYRYLRRVQHVRITAIYHQNTSIGLH